MIFTVSNSDELVSAFQSASGGDRIELLGGEYQSLRLKNRDFDADVTITSADASDPAIFRDALLVTDVSHLNITGVTFVPDSTALDILDLLLVRDSSQITIQSNIFKGHIPLEGEGIPIAEDIDTRDEARGLIEGQAFARGVRLDDAENVVILGNTFSDLRKGIILDTVQNVSVSGNHLHDLRSDGINLVDAVSVEISENLMEAFRPLHNYDNIAYADHGDFIQWWAGPGGLGIRDLTIRDNALLQGAGSWVQGIFGRSGGSNPDGSPAEFSDIRIINNLINTSHPNGIFVGDARDVEIIGNTLLPAPQDLTQPVITSGIPSIQVRTSAKYLGDNEYDFERGALPQDIRIEENVVVGDQAFTSYQIDAGLHAQLNITSSDNAVLSADPSSPTYWGNAFPDLVSEPLNSIEQLLGPSEVSVGFDAGHLAPLLGTLLADPLSQTAGVQSGSAGDDFMHADGSGRILDGAAGADALIGTSTADVIRGGSGSDTITSGLGSDMIAFHRQDLLDGDVDTIMDLDFDAGDQVVLSGGFGFRFFDDDVDGTNALTTFRSGDSAIVHDLADLAELVAQDRVSAHSAGPEAVDLRFDLTSDGETNWTLRLHGISDIGETHSSLDASGLTLLGTLAADSLTGSFGNDVLHASGGDDLLGGGAGADRFHINWADLLDGTHLKIADLNFEDGDQLVLESIPWSAPTHQGLVTHDVDDRLTITSSEGFASLLSSQSVAVANTDETRTIVVFKDTDGVETNSILELSGVTFGPQPESPSLLVGTAGDELLRGLEHSDDRIFGGAGDDLLDGRSGADALFGGQGNDRYYIDSQEDRVAEFADQGYDRIYASIDFTIPDFTEAITARGIADLRLTGNAADNWMTGNSGNNVLRGGEGADRLIARDGNDWLDGGEGSDILQGGLGDDQYVVDQTTDQVIEQAGDGYDRVYTTVDFHLNAGVEALSARGNSNVALSGNDGANWITGNVGANEISGGNGADRLLGRDGDDTLSGNAGADVLEGGGGRDVFTFKIGDGTDVIRDFDAGSDMLLIDIFDAHLTLQANETSLGVVIQYGDQGDAIVLSEATQETLQNAPIFITDGNWTLDF